MECVYQSPQCQIYRMGNPFVNWYVMLYKGQLLVIDGGLPGQWTQLEGLLARLNKTTADVDTILLTHSHTDHMGIAERLRQASGAPVWIHESDAATAQETQQQLRPPMAMFRNIWRPSMMRMVRTMMRDGMTMTPVQEIQTFTAATRLPIDGAPEIIHVPGHSPGLCAFFFPEERVLFSGDTIVTFNLFQARNAPPTLPPAQDEALMRDSVTRLEGLGTVLMLPGHGNPWNGLMSDAVHQVLS